MLAQVLDFVFRACVTCIARCSFDVEFLFLFVLQLQLLWEVSSRGCWHSIFKAFCLCQVEADSYWCLSKLIDSIQVCHLTRSGRRSRRVH